MILFIECAVLCVIFSLLVVPRVKHNPLKWAYDYPPAIQKRLKELGLVENDSLIKNKGAVIRKICFSIITAIIFSALLYFLNGAENFAAGFIDSYIIWFAVTWFDAIVMDCIWFCHDKSIIIKGTEDMVSEYHNYRYHIIASLKGSLIGLPVCAAVGGLIELINIFIN